MLFALCSNTKSLARVSQRRYADDSIIREIQDMDHVFWFNQFLKAHYLITLTHYTIFISDVYNRHLTGRYVYQLQ